MNLSRARLLPVLGAALLLIIQPMRGHTMNDDIAAQVDTAFTAAREGHYELISQLGEQGAKVIPYLRPYVQDTSEMVRLQAVALLTASTDARAVPLLEIALTDASQDIRARAALGLYERHDPGQLATRPELGEALRASVNQGNDAAAAILLLSYFPAKPRKPHWRRCAGAPPTDKPNWRPGRRGAGPARHRGEPIPAGRRRSPVGFAENQRQWHAGGAGIPAFRAARD